MSNNYNINAKNNKKAAIERKGVKSQRIGQIGINTVEDIVLNDWNSRWQQLDAQNDDGIDGLIFIERDGEATGQIVFAQVKCTDSPVSEKRTRVAINREKLKRNVRRWRRVVGAAILIHIDPGTRIATWVNLRDQAAIGNTQVYVPNCQKFNKSAKNNIANLCGTIHRDVILPQVDTVECDFIHMRNKDDIQTSSRQLYKNLNEANVKLGNIGPCVMFTCDGWEHLTRKRRSHLSEIQSFILLGTVRKILEATPEEALVKDKTANSKVGMVYAARAAVTFSFRQTAIVKVLLRKCEAAHGAPTYSFFAVYEPKRKRNILGARGPLFLQAT